jgi:hypothetical protein
MTSPTSLPSREQVLEHGVPLELIDRLRGQARIAQARAIAAALSAGVRTVRRALGDAWSHSPFLRAKAL